MSQTDISLTTPNDQISVIPGEKVVIPLVLTNQGALADQLRISIEGIPFTWASSDQQVVMLQPGEQRAVNLTVEPPALPNARIGRYDLQVLATSSLDPSRVTRAAIALSVAGYEVRGRVTLLLDSLQQAVTPGEKLVMPLVLINQGLEADRFRLAVEELPAGWFTLPPQSFRLAPGEMVETTLTIQPPRIPDARAGRNPFRILVTSQAAPDQVVSASCILTVAAFFQFQSTLQPPQTEPAMPASVSVQNLSNVPATFQVSLSSPEDALAFEPAEPQTLNAALGETVKLEYTARPTRRVWVGGERSYPYTASVQASDGQAQAVQGTWLARGMIPTWLFALGIIVLLLLAFLLLRSVWQPAGGGEATPGETPTVTATILIPTATTSQLDQLPLLIERNWFLLSYNDVRSSAGAQEAFTLFNPDGSLIGYTGCKDFNARYTTNFNQIAVENLNLSTGTCPSPELQQQEDAMVAILRSARSYFVADTALQIAGDSGFLNYSLTPIDRTEELQPPQAVIQAVPQSQTGEAVVFDGSRSSGDYPIVAWRWEFGDGATASGAVVQHVYLNPGTFSVRLTVQDLQNQSGSATQQMHVLPAPLPTQPTATPQPTAPPAPTQAPAQPTPTPTITPEPTAVPVPPQASLAGPSSGFIGEPVTFDASASQPGSSPIVSFSWSFGNGAGQPASPSPQVSTTYTRAGMYEVSVLVTDATGLSSNATRQITIDARLDSAVWTLGTLNNQPVLPGTAITLQFLAGELAGFTGCNNYFGSYTSSDNGDGSYSVSVGPVSTGQLACPRDIANQETDYLAALQGVTSARTRENMLTLTSSQGELVFYLVEPN
jgi:heat shock protein HslJ